MSTIGNYKVPSPIKDEDKWFKYFTKRQVAAVIVVIAVDYQLVMWTKALHLIFVGIILSLLLAIVVGICVMASMPKNKYLFGGGVGLDELLIRVLSRKLVKKNRVIYTLAQEEDTDYQAE